MRSTHPLYIFKIRFDKRTVLPPPLGASTIIRGGTFGTCACLDCLRDYSFKSIGVISAISKTKRGRARPDRTQSGGRGGRCPFKATTNHLALQRVAHTQTGVVPKRKGKDNNNPNPETNPYSSPRSRWKASRAGSMSLGAPSINPLPG